MPVPCVLVVDDDPEIRSLLSIYLESLGFGCLEAGSGKEALRILETRTIHAIISDLEMPGMTGTELYARIQHAWARLAQYFVLMTGSGNLPSEQGYPVLSKPFTREGLQVILLNIGAYTF